MSNEQNPAQLRSNLVTPDGQQPFPRLVGYGWFLVNEVKQKLNPAQVDLVDPRSDDPGWTQHVACPNKTSS